MVKIIQPLKKSINKFGTKRMTNYTFYVITNSDDKLKYFFGQPQSMVGRNGGWGWLVIQMMIVKADFS